MQQSNSSSVNDTQTYTLDTTAPDAPVINPVNGTDPITGTAEPGSTVTVTYPNGDTATVVEQDLMAAGRGTKPRFK